MIVAIDGPSGSGKSTISKLVAERLGFACIDTGAIYRTLALVAERDEISLEDASSLGKLAMDFPIAFRVIDSVNRVFFRGEDVTESIRVPSVSMNASRVSSYPEVRKALLRIQRELGVSGNSVLEGRDIGTVIFPDADFKFFLTAGTDVRAERRQKELREKGVELDLSEVKKQIIQRDRQDRARASAPLKKAGDAILIDSSLLSIEEVVNHIASIVRVGEAKK